MNKEDEFLAKARMLKDEIRSEVNQRSMSYRYHDAEVSVLEGVFARGDRKLDKLIEAAYRNGALFDSWTDTFNSDAWKAAFEETGIDPYFYTARERSEDELFPWDFIDIGVTKEFLKKEWKKSQEAVTTVNCREGCSGCGARCFGGGICFAAQG